MPNAPNIGRRYDAAGIKESTLRALQHLPQCDHVRLPVARSLAGLSSLLADDGPHQSVARPTACGSVGRLPTSPDGLFRVLAALRCDRQSRRSLLRRIRLAGPGYLAHKAMPERLFRGHRSRRCRLARRYRLLRHVEKNVVLHWDHTELLGRDALNLIQRLILGNLRLDSRRLNGQVVALILERAQLIAKAGDMRGLYKVENADDAQCRRDQCDHSRTVEPDVGKPDIAPRSFWR